LICTFLLLPRQIVHQPIRHSYVGAELLSAENPVSGLKDTWYISEYAIGGVQLVWRVGIMNSDSQHNFGPQKTVSRADAAMIFMRLSKALTGERLTLTV